MVVLVYIIVKTLIKEENDAHQILLLNRRGVKIRIKKILTRTHAPQRGRGDAPGIPYWEWQHQREASALYRVGAFFVILLPFQSLNAWVVSFVYTLFIPNKTKTTENQKINSRFQYPDPGSNRDGLLHWCLRPARLPIPPSGLVFLKTVQRYN